MLENDNTNGAADTPASNDVVYNGQDNLTNRESGKRNVTDIPLDLAYIPLLITRYALADGARSKPQGPFKVDGPECPAGTHYTLRWLRTGYLHVYSENHKTLTSYITDDNGSLTVDPTSLKQGYTKDPNDDLFPQPMGILEVHNSNTVWMAFSDSPWTKAIVEKAMQEDFRSKHMRKVVLQDYSSGWAALSHIAPLAEVGEHVASVYPQLKDKYDFSPHPFNSLNKRHYTKIDDAPQGAIVALDDPAGIAMDLTMMILTKTKKEFDVEEPDYKIFNKLRADKVAKQKQEALDNRWRTVERQEKDQDIQRAAIQQQMIGSEAKEAGQRVINSMADHRTLWNRETSRIERDYPTPKPITTEWAAATASIIFDLKASIGQNAMNEQIAEAWRMGGRVRSAPESPFYMTWEQRKKSIAKIEGSIKEDAWKKYGEYFREKDLLTWWKDKYTLRLEALDSKLKPIAESWVKWVESAPFNDYFNGHFDPKDAGNGYYFSQTILNCYKGTQDKGPCAEHVVKTLKTELGPNTPLARAFLFNLEELTTKANHLKPAQSATSKSALEQGAKTVQKTLAQWKSLISETAKKTQDVERLRPDYGKGVIAGLLSILASPLSKISCEGQLTPGLAAAAVAAGDTVYELELTGTAAMKAEALFIAASKQLAGKGIHPEALKLGTEVNVEFLRQRAAPTFDSAESTVKVLLTKDVQVPKDPTLQPQAVADMFHFDEKAKVALKPTRLDCGLKIFGALMAYASFCAVSGSVSKTMSFEKEEAGRKLGFAGVSLISATMGVVETGLKFVPAACCGPVASALKGVVKYGGGLLGCAAGLYAVISDACGAYEAAHKKRFALMWCYVATSAVGFAGLVLSFAGLFWEIPVYGWIVAALAFVAGMFLAHFTPGNIQKWLEKTCWGDGYYPSFELEQMDPGIARG